MVMPLWPPRDWRQFIALFFLAGAGIAMTVFAWRLATLTADRSTGPWAIAYALYGTIGLIGVVITGFSYVLGRRAYSGRLGREGAEFTSSGGDEP